MITKLTQSVSPEVFVEGETILVDKPLNWTSFDVVNKIRHTIRHNLGIKKIKVGHAGTLDPLATGLVIVCTGKDTKKIQAYQNLEKEYIATFCFGAKTPSYDLETEIDETFPYEHLSEKYLNEIIEKHFMGEIEQVPPVFSAKKVDGKRSYEFARKGEKKQLSPKKRYIYKFEILEYKLPEVKFRIWCSSGTYIRALARDLGTMVKSGAYLKDLKRTKIGEFLLADSIKVTNFANLFEKR